MNTYGDRNKNRIHPFMASTVGARSDPMIEFFAEVKADILIHIQNMMNAQNAKQK